jgi:hypothetical protein
MILNGLEWSNVMYEGALLPGLPTSTFSVSLRVRAVYPSSVTINPPI